MFSVEYNGYNKKEVDEYLTKIKTKYERTLMDEKLRVLEAEKKVYDLKKKNANAENLDKNIASFFEVYKKSKKDEKNKLDFLRVEQLKMIYSRLRDFLQELNVRYPGLLVNNSYKKLLTDIENIIKGYEGKKDVLGASTENDSMRILLNKMQGKKVQDDVKEVRIERVHTNETNQIRPVCDLELKEGEKYDNLVDKFLDTKPTEKDTPKIEIQSNGFDLKEAINPKDDLSEIMKAFDFFSPDDDE